MTQFESVFIAPDQAKFEWEKHLKLVIKLRERKAKGETNLIVRNGCIISRPAVLQVTLLLGGQITCLNPPDTSPHGAITKDITILYTNANQFLNKINDLEIPIAGSEPDLILITKILPKYHLYCINKVSLMIPGYSLYLNFDPDSDRIPTLDIRGVEIFISKH